MKIRIAQLVLFLLISSASLYASDTFTFRANRMTGGRASGQEVTILMGNAEVRSNNILLRANQIQIHGSNNQFIDCIGGVWGMDLEKDIVFQTDRLRYDRNLKVARLEGNSTLEDRQNEIVAKARFIEYDEQHEIAVLQVAVRLFRDNLVSRAEYAVYRRTNQILELSGFPVVFRGNDEFRADRIRVDLETDDIAMDGGIQGSIRD